MLREKLHNFVEKIQQDNFVNLDKDLKNILCTKVAIKVDEKIKVITGE
jgi:hypothetical protein